MSIRNDFIETATEKLLEILLVIAAILLLAAT